MFEKNWVKNEHYRRNDTVFITVKRRGKPDATILIDAEDLPVARSYRAWRISGGRCGLEYAVAMDHTHVRRTVMLHRVVMKTPEDQKCIIVSGNNFDCRKTNLQNVNKVRPRSARRKPPEDDHICLHAKYGTFRVSIWANSRNNYVGSFKTIEEARVARDAAMKAILADTNVTAKVETSTTLRLSVFNEQQGTEAQ